MKMRSLLVKTLAAVCAVLMMVNLFGGCGKDSSSTDTGSTTGTSQASAAADPFANHLKYTISGVDGAKAGLDKDGNPDEHYQWLLEKFNVEFEWVPLTWSNYLDQTRLWISAGDAPDLFMMDIAPARYNEYTNWVKNGQLKAYPDLEKYPNMAKKMDEMITGKKFFVDGKLYAWPAAMDNLQYNYAQAITYRYRKDWAEKLGMAKPEGELVWEFDEWCNLVKAVIEKDPGGNGPGKTVGMTGNQEYLFPQSFGASNISPYLLRYTKGPDGKWVWGPTLPESLEAIKTVRKMYDDKIIWKDQILAKGDGGLFTAGQAFASVSDSVSVTGFNNGLTTFVKSNPTVDPQKAIGIALVKGPNGKLVSYQAADQWSQQGMNPKLSDEKVDRWCSILDYLVSDEGYYFRNMGIKDKDWVMENGKPVVKWPKDDKGNYIAPFLPEGTTPWSRIATCSDNFGLISPAYPQWVRDLITSVNVRINESDVTSIKVNPDLNYFSAPNFDKVGNKEKEIYQEIEKLMTSNNLEIDWNDWVKSKMTEVQPVLDELNAKLK